MTRSSRRSSRRKLLAGSGSEPGVNASPLNKEINCLGSHARWTEAAQGWTGHPSHSCEFELSLHRTPAPDVVALCLVTRYASRNAAFGPMDCSCRKGAVRGSSAHRTRPWPQCRSQWESSAVLDTAISCLTRKVRRRDGWRPIQTTSGPLLLNG